MSNNNYTKTTPALTNSISKRQKEWEKIKRARGIRRATEKLEAKRAERISAEKAKDNHLNTGVDDYDFLAEEKISEKAESEYKALCDAVEKAKIAEQQAREELWSAKYDTMTDSELQAAVVDIADGTEKGYVTALQENRVRETRQKDLKTMSSIGDPESVLYDPDFETKSAYRSTKLTDGGLGESDTGYADIDYEFINGNEDISELIVGMDRNYYYITDQERQIYNYWHNYDQEHGTEVAKKYLNLLQEVLNDRDSAEDYAKIEGEAIQEILYGVKSGLSRFGNDWNNRYLKKDGYIPMTSTEMTARRAYEGLADEGNFKINGQTLSQHMFNGAESFGYNLPGNVFGGLTGQGSKIAGAVVKGVFAGISDNNAAYREMINRGYTSQQASKYSNQVGAGSGVLNTAANLIQNGTEKLWKNSFGGQLGVTGKAMDALGKILTNNDWLGIKDSLQSVVEDSALKNVTGEDKPEEALQTAAKSAVVAKAMDKIFNRMGANPEEISLDLRISLLDALKDPTVREGIARFGGFTPEQLEEITARLESVGDQDAGIGTYAGDAIFWENGAAMSRKYLQQMVDKAIRDRDKEIDDPVAKAIYEKYMPR